MEEELINAYKQIQHSDKRFSISHLGTPQISEVDYSITLTFTPDFLSSLKPCNIEDNKDFKNEMTEFGGIIFYNGENYVRRINLNLSKEGVKWSTTKGLQFYVPSINSESNLNQDSALIDYNNGETFIEYFSMKDVREKLHQQLDNIFVEFKIWDYIYLTKYELIFKIWPSKGERRL